MAKTFPMEVVVIYYWSPASSYGIFFIQVKPCNTNLSVSITDQNHFMQKFSIRLSFRNNFPKDEEQFLDHVILQWQHKSNNCHQDPWHFFSIQNVIHDPFEGICFDRYVSLFWKKK